jgi:hypothetical protein
MRTRTGLAAVALVTSALVFEREGRRASRLRLGPVARHGILARR